VRRPRRTERARPRSGARPWLAALVPLLLVAGLLVLVPAAPAAAAQDVRTVVARVPSGSGADAVSLDTTLYVPASATDRDPAPAVVLAHGFGGSKESVAGDARDLAGRGYVVLTYSARGFGRSTGQIGLDDPRYEIADLSTLIDLLSRRRDVQQDHPGDPRVGVAGASYGGGVALLGAAHDRRIDAIVPQITWNSLTAALFPSQAGIYEQWTPAGTPQDGADGVYKRLWAGLLFTAGSLPGGGLAALAGGGSDSASGDGSGASADGGSSGAGSARAAAAALGDGAGDPAELGRLLRCGRFRPDICAAYQQAAATGTLTPEIKAILDRSSPASVLDRIHAPTLLIQGTQDSLFGLGQADANARGIAGNGTPVKVVWYSGGHDVSASDAVTAELRDQVAGWFDWYVRHRGPNPGTGFSFPAPVGVSGTQRVQGNANGRTEIAPHYPGLAGVPAVRREAAAVAGPAQPVVAPAGGTPAAISSLPGLGQLGGALAGVADIPGQFAAFEGRPLSRAVDVVGAPVVDLAVSSPTGTATLFAKLYDEAPGGAGSLPSGLVAPLALSGLSTDPSAPTHVQVTLPAIDHRFEAGHSLRLVVSSTDQAYALPAQSTVYTVALAGGRSADLGLPEVDGRVQTDASQARWWVLVGALAGLALLGWAAALLWGRRRERRLSAVEPDGEDIPLRFEGVTKAYKDGFVAVRDLTFDVRRGQVLGLLGPNGAGKTTSLRMLMGLLRPTEGRIRVFGHEARPGAPVLSRLGSFVEGTGLLPHLSGRDNLTLYWAATGRPIEDAHLDEAIEVAGLGTAIDKRVRTYSQGMRQRVAIAQSMLGLPDLLVLDEPTNGLDPPQIHAMRDVLRSYAQTGRTVIVSSHLLAEIEQTCSHVVVMAKGEKIAQGTVEEIIGTGGAVLVGLADPGDADRAAAVLTALGDGLSVQRADDGLVVELGGITRAAALAALVSAGIGVAQFTPRRHLEDAFLALVGEAS
jgi:ABC-2 type transport system ATP-binding protein